MRFLTPRAHVPLAVKLAAALVELHRLRMREAGADDREFYEHSKMMTAAQVISLFQFDHYPIRHADGGPVAHWNLTPLLIYGHRRKTHKVDRPALAKQDRIEEKWREFNRAMAAGRKPPRRTSKWPKRPMRRANPAKSTRKVKRALSF